MKFEETNHSLIKNMCSDKNIKKSIVRLTTDLYNTHNTPDFCVYLLAKGNRKSKLCNDSITTKDPELMFCHKHRRCAKTYRIEEKPPSIQEKLIDFAVFRASCIELVV